MGIRESLLNTITSVGSSDFVRIVTSAGASSKATLQNVIKSFETGLGAKSSLTDSDYIRVVGSDNNLYKQSVSSMKSDMGISALEANDGTKIYNGTDLNTLALPANYKKTRVYYGEDITQMTNRPSDISNAWPFCLICLPIGGFYTKQILHIYGTTGTPDNVYVRTQSYISGGTAWTSWVNNGKTVINTSTNFTSATTLSYTGVSYTIPANTFYAIMFNAVFINNGPQEILLSKSNSSTNPYLVLAHSNGGAMASIAGTTDESITVYVWARYGGVGQNRMDIDGIVKSL